MCGDKPPAKQLIFHAIAVGDLKSHLNCLKQQKNRFIFRVLKRRLRILVCMFQEILDRIEGFDPLSAVLIYDNVSVAKPTVDADPLTQIEEYTNRCSSKRMHGEYIALVKEEAKRLTKLTFSGFGLRDDDLRFVHSESEGGLTPQLSCKGIK
jgi:hypothetical protein